MSWRLVANLSFSLAYLFVAFVVLFGRAGVEQTALSSRQIKTAGASAVSMSRPANTGLVSTHDGFGR